MDNISSYEKDISKYQEQLVNLYDFYNKIYGYLKIEFIPFLLKKDSFDIDFNNLFVISNTYQEESIYYDREIDKFRLSFNNAKENYNKLKKEYNNIDDLSNLQFKISNFQKYDFSYEELKYIISYKNISFEDYIKSQFLHEIINRVINLLSSKKIYYADEYKECTIEKGFYFNKAVVECITRNFAKKYNIFYLPKEIGNRRVIILINILLKTEKYKLILFNENIDILLNNIDRKNATIIENYEELLFEKENKLEKNSLKYYMMEVGKYGVISLQKMKLLNKLKEMKKILITDSNNFPLN